MEECLAREEAHRRQRSEIAGAAGRFQMLMAGGERRAAIAAARLPQSGESADAAGLAASVQEIEHRLCRGNSVVLGLEGGTPVRFAALPATLGRDGTCALVVRDPGASRLHALIAHSQGRFTIEDLRSRGGTRLGLATVGEAVPLPPDGTLTLGERCVLRFRFASDILLEVLGTSGLDRTLRTYLGPPPLALAPAFPGTDGLRLRFDRDTWRLERDASVQVRVDNHLIGSGCDLLRGDVIDVNGGRLRVDVL
jgi:hypothetical protein